MFPVLVFDRGRSQWINSIFLHMSSCKNDVLLIHNPRRNTLLFAPRKLTTLNRKLQKQILREKSYVLFNLYAPPQHAAIQKAPPLRYRLTKSSCTGKILFLIHSGKIAFVSDKTLNEKKYSEEIKWRCTIRNITKNRAFSTLTSLDPALRVTNKAITPHPLPGHV